MAACRTISARTAIRHWRQQRRGARCAGRKVTRRCAIAINAVFGCRRRSALFNQIVHQRLKTGLISCYDGDALQLAGRGSWFVATSEELPELQRRVDERADDYSVVTGQRRVEAACGAGV